jgi:hypothetical protein
MEKAMKGRPLKKVQQLPAEVDQQEDMELQKKDKIKKEKLSIKQQEKLKQKDKMKPKSAKRTLEDSKPVTKKGYKAKEPPVKKGKGNKLKPKNASASAKSIYAENLQRTRFIEDLTPSDEIKVPINAKNQYTQETLEQRWDDRFKWLCSISQVIHPDYVSPEETSLDCWVADDLAPGITKHPTKGYLRLNFMRAKIFIHIFAWLYFHPGEFKKGKPYEFSHRCGNPKCWNPHHIFVEEKIINLSRSKCHGLLIINGKAYKDCDHWPVCLHHRKSELILVDWTNIHSSEEKYSESE